MEVPANEINIPELDKDTLVVLFRYFSNKELKKVAKVCPLWRSAAYCATTWKGRIVQLNADKDLREDRLKRLADRRIKHVVLRNYSIPKTYDDYPQFSALSNGDIQPEETEFAAKLEHNRIQLQSVLQHLSPTLHTLDISMVLLHDNNIQRTFNSKMNCLKRLDLSESGCHLVTYDAATVLTISRHCPNLEEFYAQTKVIPPAMVQTLGRNMPHLREVFFDSETVISFTDETLQDIRTFMPNLKTLDLDSDHITNAGIAHVAQMQHLEYLHLGSNCHNITEDFVEKLAQAKSPIRYLSVFSENPQFHMDSLFGKLGGLADKLQIDMLTLADFDKTLTDDGLKALRESKSFPFHRLYVIAGYQITVQGLAELRKNCPNIEVDLGIDLSSVDFEASVRDNRIVFKEQEQNGENEEDENEEDVKNDEEDKDDEDDENEEDDEDNEDDKDDDDEEDEGDEDDEDDEDDGYDEDDEVQIG